MSEFHNIDCMEGMKKYPDKYFDLAIVDPPYGINIADSGNVGGENWRRLKIMVLNNGMPNHQAKIISMS